MRTTALYGSLVSMATLGLASATQMSSTPTISTSITQAPIHRTAEPATLLSSSNL